MARQGREIKDGTLLEALLDDARFVAATLVKATQGCRPRLDALCGRGPSHAGVAAWSGRTSQRLGGAVSR
jgi:hypothetical protein